MAAKWSFGSVGIYVEEESGTRELKRAELFVLDATASVKHFFGAASQKYTITGLIPGSTDVGQLKTWATGNTAQTFTTPWGGAGSYFIDGEVEEEIIRYTGATIDGVTYDVAVTPIYRVTLNLIAND